MSPKAPPVFKRPTSSSAQSEAKLAALADRAEARGNAVAGQPLPEEAPPQARKAASLQARKSASLQTSRDGVSAARSGTQAEPYVRARDGQVTRSTTVHLPVELLQQLRLQAATREVHMSAIVTEAVRDWLERGRP